MDDRLKSRSSSLNGRARFRSASLEDKKPSNPCAASGPDCDHGLCGVSQQDSGACEKSRASRAGGYATHPQH